VFFVTEVFSGYSNTKICVSSALNVINLLNIFFCWCAPFGYLYFLYFSNEPEMGTEIDSGMVMKPFPSSLLDETRFEPTTYRS
jgi:hypothetical protein